jgi:arginyl-tRNA synthetase
MQSVLNILEARISEVMAKVPGSQGCPALVRLATDAKFGDYQVNGVMPLAKQLKTNPRKLAEQIVAKLDSATADKLSDICESPEIAGPGFINLRLKPEFISANLLQISKDTDRFGIEKAEKPQTIVVDFSGPNIAKQMHVGHLRSTIIGDCICRLLELQGHKVIRQNHFGNWGTQFGRVILALWHICMAENLHKNEKPYYDLKQLLLPDDQNTTVFCNQIIEHHQKDWLEDSKYITGDGERYFHPFLEEFSSRSKTLWPALLKAYQYVNVLDDFFKGMKRKIQTRKKNEENQFIYEYIPYESLSSYITFMLQRGGDDDAQERKAWKEVGRITLDECNEIYKELNVTLKDSDVRGESAYNDDLPDVVAELKKKGLAVESEGAVCVFPDGFKDKEGKPLPVIVQKSDGAYLYATTDLAAIRYRVGELKADRIIYVTDARQGLHFEMVFAVARMAKWVKPETELVHVTFGSVLGEDGKPLKTRSGENVKLKELLDEAIERARKVVEEKNPGLSEDEKKKIANAVGIGAVKYADYTNNRTSDYIFSFDKMLAMEGNTAPYMQYAYARIKSINRKGKERGIDVNKELAGVKELSIGEPSELDLAKHLIRYGEAVSSSAGDYRPNYLTAYLYDLAQKFSSFYNDCPVLDASADKRPTRLLLCDLTAKTIEHGLHNLLGIEVIEQM